MDWSYSKKEYYWQRRKIVETLFSFCRSKVPNLEALSEKLLQLNKQIRERHNSIKYRCVYALRKDQKLDKESLERGGYCDTWWRSNQFNLLMDEDMTTEEESQASEDNEVPTSNNPIIVYLKPSKPVFSPITEFTKCIHPECIHSNYDLINSKVIYLFCMKHSDENIVKILEDVVINQKIVSNFEKLQDNRGYSVKEMLEHIIVYLTLMISQSLNRAIQNAKDELKSETLPDRVLEIECIPFPEVELKEDEDYEWIKIYVDLVDCQKIEIK